MALDLKSRFTNAPVWAATFLSAVSFFTTYQGMNALLEQYGRVSAVTATVVALGLTMSVQCILLWAAWRVVHGPRIWTRFLGMLAYLCTLTISVTFSFGFWFQTISGDDYTREQYQHSTQAVAAVATRFRTGYARFVETLEQLAEYSANTARREIERGGTCGDNSPPKPGPRARLRQADADRFTGYLPHFRARLKEVDAIVSGLDADVRAFDSANHAEFQQNTRVALLELRQFESDPRVGELGAFLKTRLEQARRGFPMGASGRTFKCPDVSLETTAESLIGFVFPTIPEIVFSAFDPSARADSIALALQRLLAVAQTSVPTLPGKPKSVDELKLERRLSVIEGRSAAIAPALTEQDKLPLLLGLIVDMLIFLCALLSPGSQDRSDGLGQIPNLQARRSAIAPDFLRRVRQLIDLPPTPGESEAMTFYRYLGDRVLRLRDTDYLLVRSGSQSSDYAGAETRLADLLLALNCARLAHPGMKRLPRALADAVRSRHHAQESQLGLYRLRNGFLDALVIEAVTSVDSIPDPEVSVDETDNSDALSDDATDVLSVEPWSVPYKSAVG